MKTIRVTAAKSHRSRAWGLSSLILLPASLIAAEVQSRYYGHEAVHDQYGVIATWYRGLNGQCDLRVRIAAETLKRYPWTSGTNAITQYPAYVFSGFWQISSNGVITLATRAIGATAISASAQPAR